MVNGFLLYLYFSSPSRVSLSDGSESDSSSPSPPTRREAPALLKTTNNQVRDLRTSALLFFKTSRREPHHDFVFLLFCQILEVKSPIKQNKNNNGDCDKVHVTFYSDQKTCNLQTCGLLGQSWIRIQSRVYYPDWECWFPFLCFSSVSLLLDSVWSFPVCYWSSPAHAHLVCSPQVFPIVSAFVSLYSPFIFLFFFQGSWIQMQLNFSDLFLQEVIKTWIIFHSSVGPSRKVQ